MTSVSKDDYLIGVGQETKRPIFFKVSNVVKGVAEGVLEKDSHLPSKRKTVEVPIKDVILNLGSDPYPGKVLGFDTTTLYRSKKMHDEFGLLYFMYKAEPSIRQDLMKVFSNVYSVLKKNRLDFIVQPNTCVWEILPAGHEKFAGMYRRSKNPEKSPHRLQIRPELMPSTDWPYVVYHELGHHLHYEFLTSKKLNARWVQLFNTSIKTVSIKREKSTELLDQLLAQEDMPSAFKANLSEEDTEVYKLILKTIGQQHSVSVKELDILFEADYKDEIRGVWPVRGVSKKDLAPIVSEYSCKNYKELLAESVAFKLTGRKLPKSIEELLDKTFSYARSNQGVVN